MTSANPPNEPIVKDNVEALRILGGNVDYFLFHDRQIAHRCDDSVTRVHGDRNAFIRRSRGYAPAPVMLKQKAKRCIVGLGGELNNTSCVLNQDKAFISQHVGDVENLSTRGFLKEATAHLIRLTNSKVEAVACDLHPKFTTTHLAKELAEKNGWQLTQVQHHHAHVAALMAEHNVDEIVGVACDGYGYGTDGQAWGGEILHCTRGSAKFKRLGHLEPQPLLGGDVATRNPIRIAAGILSKKTDVGDWLMQHADKMPHGKAEAILIQSQLQNHAKGAPQTTSLGRVLDAAAAVLGVCYERTYEGEATMKLESAAVKGKDVLELASVICGDTLDTTQMLLSVYQNRGKYSVADLSYSVHAYLAKGLAALAVEKAVGCSVETVGFTGGSAVNSLLARLMREGVEAEGLRFLVHEAVPSGDGGVSLGQAVVGGFCRF